MPRHADRSDAGPRRAWVLFGVLLTLGITMLGLWIGSQSFLAPGPPWDPWEGTPTPSQEPTSPSSDESPVGAPTSPAAPETVTAFPTAPPPLLGLRVLLDPGHNSDNSTNGAIIQAQVPNGRGGKKACNEVGTTTLGGYPEHAFNWDVADRTRVLLEEAGAEVVLTRAATGVGPCVDVRGQAAELNDVDLMVSIHANGTDSRAAQGFFVIVVGDPLNKAQGEPSRALAEQLAQSLELHGFTPSNWVDRISSRNDMATLNHSTRPAVMLELAELRHPVEGSAAQDPAVRQRYAEAVAVGIAEWVAAN